MNIQEKIEVLIKEKRKSRKDLAEILFVTYSGLIHKIKHDTFKAYEIEKMETFFEVERGYFDTENKVEAKTPSMWEVAKEQYDARVKELTQALEDARYTIQLQKKMLEGKANFLNLSKRPPVKRAFMSGMYVSQISLMRA